MNDVTTMTAAATTTMNIAATAIADAPGAPRRQSSMIRLCACVSRMPSAARKLTTDSADAYM